MKRILFITFRFPPENSMGSYRTGAMAKYLEKMEYQIIVVTKSCERTEVNDVPQETKRAIIYRLNRKTKEIKRHIGVEKDKVIKKIKIQHRPKNQRSKFHIKLNKILKDIFRWPDGNYKWYNFAKTKIMEIVENEKPDIILSSALPPSVHILAAKIVKKTGLPWIADYRDLWYNNPLFKRIFPFNLIEKLIEKRTMKYCKVITSVSMPLCNTLKNLHNKKTYLIYNGFDDKDITNYNATRKIEKFKITYTGSLHPIFSPTGNFVKAINYLISKNNNIEKLEVNFWGDGISPNVLKKYPSVRGYIHNHSKTSHQKVIEEQRNSHILLLIIWNYRDLEGVLTGKLFEYLAARRPILAVGPYDKYIDKILKETNTGILLSDYKNIAEYICNCYNEFIDKGYISYNGKIDKIMKYSRKNQVEKFRKILVAESI